MREAAGARHVSRMSALFAVLSSEGFRLFFPLAAVHAGLWSTVWAIIYGLHLPFAVAIPSSLWHANEMLFGTFGAAVAGFITTAVPEWTDTKPLARKALLVLAGCWLVPRLAGLVGGEGLLLVLTIGDAVWPTALVFYVVHVSWRRRDRGLAGIAFWLTGFWASSLVTRFAFLTGDLELAHFVLHIVGLVLLGLLGLALSRITVIVTNLVIDPSETTSPFRPHPGRLHLAPSLVAVAIAGEILGVSSAVGAYLLIAAGAAFLDRVAEAFVGPEILRSEILVLGGSSLFAGLGLVLVGVARLGAPLAEVPAWHLSLMGGLGLGVLAVFAIAGLRHTGRPLGVPIPVRMAFVCVVAATGARILPDLGVSLHPPGLPYGLAAAFWALAFLLWLRTYWPFLTVAETGELSDS